MHGPVNEVDIEAEPEQVFDVLSDPTTYPEWLVGAQAIRAVDDGWPEVGTRFHHRIGIGGPLTVPGSTSVRRVERPNLLELGAGLGPFGEARVVFRLSRLDGRTHLAIEEEPRRGAARAAWALLRPAVVAGLWGRNALSLASLRALVEKRSGIPSRATPDGDRP